jgi:hypothetical protein
LKLTLKPIGREPIGHNLRADFHFVLEEPSGKLIVKLNQDADATAISHFEIPYHARLTKFGNHGLGHFVTQPTYSYLLSNFHRNTKTDTKTGLILSGGVSELTQNVGILAAPLGKESAKLRNRGVRIMPLCEKFS